MTSPQSHGFDLPPRPGLDGPPAAGQPGAPPASRARELFVQALGRTDPAERQRYLEEACAGDPDLRLLVVSLLQCHAQAGDFLEQTVLEESSRPDVEGPGTVIGPYKLLEKIGEGGFGTVYVAEQETPVRRRVALKVIKLGMDTRSVVARFEAERQALARMDHPNIARIFDAGATASGRPYFVMELVRGARITEFCAEHGLDTRQRLELFMQVCHAVQHAHQKGIIHRDLKPSNVLVSLHDTTPIPKVIDFGVAKAMEGRLTDKTLYTAWEQLIGTPAYMSPEQAKLSGLDVDSRSDIYSLGVLLYELLTGMTPFDSQELARSGLEEMRKIICEREPVRPSTRLARLRAGAQASSKPERPKIESDLDWIVMRCLEKDRARRYETANGLAMDIERHLKYEAVLARPPSLSYQLGKWARRHRVAFGIASVVAAAVLAVATMAIISAQEERSIAERLQDGLARERLHRGQLLCEQNKMAGGLHWLVNSLETAPQSSQALRRVIEDNLAAWGQRWLGPELVLFHDSVAWCGAFCGDSQKVVTGTMDGVLTAWSMPSGKVLWRTNAHGMWIRYLTVSPDGTRLLTSSDDGTVRLWSTESGEALAPPLPRTGIEAARLSPDGRLVLAGGGTNAARIYAATSGDPLTPPLRHESEITSHAFSPDSRLVLIGCLDGTARLWDVETGQPAAADLHYKSAIQAVAFSPRKEMVAIGCGDGTVALWSIKTEARLLHTMRHEHGITMVAFDPGGNALLTASFDYSARLWFTDSGEQIGRSMRHENRVPAASFSRDGSRVVTVGADARLWSAHTAEPLGPPLRHPGGWMFDAGFSPDGQHILTVGNFSTAQLWPATNLRRTALSFSAATNVYSVGINRTGRVLAASGFWNGDVSFWDTGTGDCLGPGLVHTGGIWQIAFSPNGRQLLTAGKDGHARLWDVQSRQQSGVSLKHTDQVRAVTYSTNGQMIATGSFDRTARIWSAKDGSPLTAPLSHPNLVEDVVFTPDGKILVTGCGDGAARVWSVATGQELPAKFRHEASVLAVDISPDGRLLATGGRDNVVRFWSLLERRPTGSILQHETQVEDVAFSPDGQRLLTASLNTVCLWSVATGERIGPNLLHNAFATECAFTPDGKQAAVADWPFAKLLKLPPAGLRGLADARLWVEVNTRMQMDEQGSLRWIPTEDWRELRAQLEERGGAPLP